MSESMWMDRAQSAESKLITMKESLGAAVERVKIFKANFGVKERANGEIEIDFDKFVENLGKESATELRKIIDERYSTTLHLNHG